MAGSLSALGAAAGGPAGPGRPRRRDAGHRPTPGSHDEPLCGRRPVHPAVAGSRHGRGGLRAGPGRPGLVELAAGRSWSSGPCSPSTNDPATNRHHTSDMEDKTPSRVGVPCLGERDEVGLADDARLRHPGGGTPRTGLPRRGLGQAVELLELLRQPGPLRRVVQCLQGRVHEVGVADRPVGGLGGVGQQASGQGLVAAPGVALGERAGGAPPSPPPLPRPRAAGLPAQLIPGRGATTQTTTTKE